MQKIYSLLFTYFALIFVIPISKAQFYLDDPSFQPLLVTRNSSNIYSFIKQPDGKILTTGIVEYINSIKTQSPFRLTEDGTFDESFQIESRFGHSVVAIGKDGKIVSPGSYTGGDGQVYVHISRYNHLGQHEVTFNTEVKSGSILGGYSIAVQEDNKIVFSTVYYDDSYNLHGSLNRVDADGTPDNSFNTEYLKILHLSHIIIQADKKILIGGKFEFEDETRKNFLRLNEDGSLDTEFNVALPPSESFHSIVLQENSKILLGTSNGIYRLLSTGETDEDFNTSAYNVSSIAVQADGKILIGAWVNNNVDYIYGHCKIIRLNEDGTLDDSFTTGIGAIDYRITSIAIQTDGKILAGGLFSNFNGQEVNGIVRLNSADGSIDSQFNIRVEQAGTIINAAIQDDGKILVFGDFDNANGLPYNDIVRLNKNGSIDNSFQIGTGVDGSWDLNSGFITAVDLQKDGKILAGGKFTSFNGKVANSLIRLNVDGSVDETFHEFDLEKYYIATIAVQDDGSILVGGNDPFNADVRPLSRLFPDGKLDTEFFSLDGIIFNTVYNAKIQPDNKILLSGDFTNSESGQALHLVRLNENGTIDDSFQAPSSLGYIKKIVLQTDGKIIVLEDLRLNEYNILTNNLIRLMPDGSLDESFHPDFGDFHQLTDFVLRGDEKIFVSGFLNFGKKMILLNNDGSNNEDFFVMDYEHDNYYLIIPVQEKLLISFFSRLIQIYTLKSQNISVTSISDKQVNDPPFSIEAASTSGLPVTFSIISGPASIEGNLITLAGEPGLVKVKASQTGNEEFLSASPVETSFLVSSITSTEEKHLHLMKLYPNPSSDHFIIQLPDPSEEAEVKLYDLNGQLQHPNIFKTNSGYYIHSQFLPKGIYLLHVNVNGRNSINKIILN